MSASQHVQKLRRKRETEADGESAPATPRKATPRKRRTPAKGAKGAKGKTVKNEDELDDEPVNLKAENSEEEEANEPPPKRSKKVK